MHFVDWYTTTAIHISKYFGRLQVCNYHARSLPIKSPYGTNFNTSQNTFSSQRKRDKIHSKSRTIIENIDGFMFLSDSVKLWLKNSTDVASIRPVSVVLKTCRWRRHLYFSYFFSACNSKAFITNSKNSYVIPKMQWILMKMLKMYSLCWKLCRFCDCNESIVSMLYRLSRDVWLVP